MRALGWILFIISEVIGFIFSIIIVFQLFGITGLIIGFIVFPIVLVVAPIYALFTTGNWWLILLVYGVGFLSRIMISYDKK